jgi:uncharacterized membrane protein SpoIIM required for sporulation
LLAAGPGCKINQLYMILDLDHFLRRERPYWDELESYLRRVVSAEPVANVEEARRFYYLYQRAVSDLAKIRTFAAEPKLTAYLENLVAQAYMQLHRRRDRRTRFRPFHWFFSMFPEALRRQVWALWLSLATSLLGAVLGAGLMWHNPEVKLDLLPQQFGHLNGTPTERVQSEEENASENAAQVSEGAASFSGRLMQNNISVALRCLAFGLLAGVFTFVLLFYNGVILGLICYDYISDGQGHFLTAWLLPHGVPELTAIFIGGQGGIVLGRALVGWGSNVGLRQRLRLVRDDLATLAGGLIIMLIFAGFVEAFISQYHGPKVYGWKIFFGVVELVVMIAFFYYGGRYWWQRKKSAQTPEGALAA